MQNEIFGIEDPGLEERAALSPEAGALICEQDVAVSATRRSFIWLTWTRSPQAVPV